MHLTGADLDTFNAQGFLFLPEVFSPSDVAVMKGQLPALMSEDSPPRGLEKDGHTVRAIHGAHATAPVFDVLSRHPRLVEPARQMLQSPVYIHQFKINVKAAFEGDLWKWHQDYIFWLKEDGMMEPRCVN